MPKHIEREYAKIKAHTCMVHTEGLIHGYSEQLTESERRAARQAQRTFEKIMKRLGRSL